LERILKGEAFKHRIGEYVINRPKIDRSYYKDMNANYVGLLDNNGIIIKAFKSGVEASIPLGISSGHISNIIRGKVKQPKIGNLKRITKKEYEEYINKQFI